jgi:hypothetical protein
MIEGGSLYLLLAQLNRPIKDLQNALATHRLLEALKSHFQRSTHAAAHGDRTVVRCNRAEV